MGEPAAGLIALWQPVGWGLAPFAGLYLRRRLGRGKEHPQRWREKTGVSAAPRPAGPLVWVHAASVGETAAVLPLAARIAAAGRSVVLTSTTVTGAAFAQSRLPAGIVHQFCPLDLDPFVAKFLAHWAPDLAIFTESELWPATLGRLAGEGIPAVIVNARMSARSHSGWQRTGRVGRPVFRRLTLVCAQSTDDAARYLGLGAPHVVETGNLKFDAPPLPADPDALAALRRAIGDRPVLVAASTHPGEEALMATLSEAVRVSVPDLLTIIVPRHPERGPAIGAALAETGARVAVRSRGDLPDAGSAFFLADTIGELGLFYRIAAVVVLGGSFVPVGGHNPIEPAQLAVATLAGPHVGNFRDVYAMLEAAGGVVRVRGADELYAAVTTLIASPAERFALATRAGAEADRNRGALQRTLQQLDPLLPPAQAGDSAAARAGPV